MPKRFFVCAFADRVCAGGGQIYVFSTNNNAQYYIQKYIAFCKFIGYNE